MIHKFFVKVSTNKNEIKILKVIRAFNQEPIIEIQRRLENKEKILETLYLDLEKLREFRKVLRSIINLGGEIRLFLDSEDDEVSLNFLDNIIASQEDTKNYIEEEDAFLHDEDE
jgi:hypothetical protein